LEYHAEVIHDYLVQKNLQNGILLSGIIAAIGIFLLLQAATASWPMALAIFLTLPAMLAGSLLAAFLNGGTISTISLFGLYAVLGIGVRNGILLVRHYDLQERNGESFGPDLVIRGSSERLTPMIMTVLATGLALLPFVVVGIVPGHEVVFPLAIVIFGGLITSLLINLFVLPALYLRYGEVREADTQLFHKEPILGGLKPDGTPGD
jgi:Cu/Ag efflux pump CusA